jgi:hypothetical protein
MDMREWYLFTNKWTMARSKRAPYSWILHDEDGDEIDRDQYRNDIISKYDLVIDEHIGGE